LPEGPTPTLTVFLTSERPDEPSWESQWVRWRDFWLPADPDDALRTLQALYDSALDERAEVACGGGIGRTGTGLATMCVFEGMDPTAAVNWVRKRYHKRAVEVPWQRRFLRRAWAASLR
jgi:protein-tyrosine phosphatase